MIKDFALRLLKWWDKNGRKDLPWQQDSDPYKIWLSEIMLQQTQVTTVIPYFERFIERFPSVRDLAVAEQDEVLHLWSGLGYYARARNLHAAAKKIVDDFSGTFPAAQAELESLPGVGRSTAGAIRAQAFELPSAILDGNVKRVLTRLEGIEDWPGSSAVEKQLWALSESLLPKERLRDYTQAIMDLGATLCTRSKPDCDNCPFQNDCVAKRGELQKQIPASKPKKTKPVRETVFLLLRNPHGQLLLEKRPPIGIWGGLWSFPEAEFENHQSRLQQLNVTQVNGNGTWLDKGSHIFSHFQLDYLPLLVEVDLSFSKQVSEASQQIWYSDALSNEIGLAAPVARLLKQIQQTQDQ